MIYYEIMTGISLASFVRILLALDAAGKEYRIAKYWKEGDKLGIRIVPFDKNIAAQAEYIDRIAERVDIGRNWIKMVKE